MSKILVLLYAILMSTIVVLSYAFIDPNLIHFKWVYTGIAFSHRVFVSTAYVIVLLLFFIFYLYFLRKALKGKLNVKQGRILFFISSLLILSHPTILSYDLFNYMSTAKVTFFYNENPYQVMPVEFIGDPMLLYTRAANKYALYGPVWILITSIPYYLGVGNFILTLFLFKTLPFAFYAGTAYLIHKLSKNDFSLFFFALNPLVLIETMVSGHNDLVMMFFALGSFYLLQQRRVLLSGFSLLISIFIKFGTLFLFPVFIYVFFNLLKGKTVNWDRVWIIAVGLMLAAFLLSPLREEMYPWYAMWFIPFVSLLKNRLVQGLAVFFSLGLMLRYLPFMYWGIYHFPAPIFRIVLMVLPVLIFIIYLLLKKKKNKWEF